MPRHRAQAAVRRELRRWSYSNAPQRASWPMHARAGRRARAHSSTVPVAPVSAAAHITVNRCVERTYQQSRAGPAALAGRSTASRSAQGLWRRGCISSTAVDTSAEHPLQHRGPGQETYVWPQGEIAPAPRVFSMLLFTTRIIPAELSAPRLERALHAGNRAARVQRGRPATPSVRWCSTVQLIPRRALPRPPASSGGGTAPWEQTGSATLNLRDPALGTQRCEPQRGCS